MQQTIHNCINITFVDSPINKLPTLTQPAPINFPTQSDKFQFISKRLEQNLKKIEQSQFKSSSPRRITNFKHIKNSIISSNAPTPLQHPTPIQHLIPTSPALPNQSQQGQIQHSYQQMSSYDFNYVCEQPIRKKLFEEQTTSQLRTAAKPQLYTTNDAHNCSSSLALCLKQIKEVKQTIKNLKQRCKNGHNGHQPMQRQKLSKERQRSGRERQGVEQVSNPSRKKYLSHSGQKYTYTNYHDLSHRKLAELSERKQRSQKSFNWIRNPIPTNEFSICTGEDYPN